jgi:N-glycosylase/DNA lyase
MQAKRTTAARILLPVRDYNLAATLDGGQAFRWEERAGSWEGVIGRRWTRLSRVSAHPGGAPTCSRLWGIELPKPVANRRSIPSAAQTFGGALPRRRHEAGENGGLAAQPEGILAETAEPMTDWQWLTDYLQIEVDLDSVLASLPDDEPMRAAVRACHGLRLLRQDPWECLASFILSSTKQIVQIRQIIARLCECFGEPIPAAPGSPPAFAFPTAARLADCTEAELRACKMGFRAPHLLSAARRVAAGELALEPLARLSLEEAREKLLHLPGVGGKIANCVLLFSCGFPAAFPVDVWVMKALRQLYFPRRRPTPRRLRAWIPAHFGPNAGYAQQYLFHYMRLTAKTPAKPENSALCR